MSEVRAEIKTKTGILGNTVKDETGEPIKEVRKKD